MHESCKFLLTFMFLPLNFLGQAYWITFHRKEISHLHLLFRIYARVCFCQLLLLTSKHFAELVKWLKWCQTQFNCITEIFTRQEAFKLSIYIRLQTCWMSLIFAWKNAGWKRRSTFFHSGISALEKPWTKCVSIVKNYVTMRQNAIPIAYLWPNHVSLLTF